MTTQDIGQTLQRLAATFSVHDIMIAEHDLICGNDIPSAQALLAEHPNFDVLPIQQDGRLAAYLERDAGTAKRIKMTDVISDGTSILDVVDVLADHRFCFVLVGQRIGGYVHFSDLNNPIVKLPFFVLIEAAERCLARDLSGRITQDRLAEVLDPQRMSFLRAKMVDLRRTDADFQWPSLLYFGELVRFANYSERISLSTPEIEAVSKVRTLVSHATDPLVEAHQDVKRLVIARKVCLSLLENLTANSLS